MARFNLGRIKGEKGDTGPKGDTGEKGDKGDKGETGATGNDGMTPVFSVGGVETLDSSLSARVELNSDDPANPELFFYIPKGSDGQDAAGDMSAAVYDTEGKQTDIYKFAQSLVESCLPKSGGQLSGKLTAYETDPSASCVRNICAKKELPSAAANGDICFLVPQNYGEKLESHDCGTTVIIDEAGTPTEYILLAKDYHKEGTVTLVRKYLCKEKVFFDYKIRNRYSGSDIDMLLETMYIRLFPDYIRKNLVPVTIESVLKRHCFLPALADAEQIGKVCEDGKVAYEEDAVTPGSYLIRFIRDNSTVYSIDENGTLVLVNQNIEKGCRPLIVLPSDMLVENITHNGEAAVRLPSENGKICLYKEGKWEELKL